MNKEEPLVAMEVADHTSVGQETPRVPLKSGFARFYTLGWTQIYLVSIIAFCLPGMYNALSGIGGGGNVDPHISAQSSVAITATAAASYFFLCLPVFDLMGVRAMGFAGWTYPLYSGSLLNYAHRGNGAFVVAAGALVGAGSAFLWTVQGAILLAYPLPHQKGRAIGVFWVIFNLGGMIGAFIAFGQNYNKDEAGTVSDGTYWAFIAIMLFGTVLAWFLCSQELVIRSDGTQAVVQVVGSKDSKPRLHRMYLLIRSQIVAVADLRHEIRLLFLLPMFFSANYFYSYQQNIVNGISFDLPGRTLNSALYWGAQMLGGLIIGALCDMPWLSRPRRALLAWIFVFVVGNVTMGGGLAFENLREQMFPNVIAFRGGHYAGPAILYFFYGMIDALWQGYTYWLLGAMCSSPEVATRLVAVYKATQGVGSAIGYVLTADNVSGRKQFISNWVLVAGSLAVALIAVLRITEPSEDEARGGLTEHEKAHLAKTHLQPNAEDEVV